jgi:hypothetical protein
VPRKGTPYGGSYPKERKRLLAGKPLCVHCLEQGRKRPATEGDHQPPLALHTHVDGSDCCVLVPSCGPCQREQAGLLAMARRPNPVSAPAPVFDGEPAGFDVADAVWDRVWLEELRDVPAEAVWPRLMTVPHPDAVGSLGDEFVAWAQARGTSLRWFQRLIATRLLEVDADGHLVWGWLLLTVARQVGKSLLLRELCLWRVHQFGRFVGPQDVLHISNQVRTGKEVMRPAQMWARRQGDGVWDVKVANESVQLEHLASGSRWMLRTPNNAYSFTAAMAFVDEAWAIPPAAIEEGVAPALVATPDAQLVLMSTAHRKATLLCLGRRRLALDALASGDGGLLIDWSASPDMEIDDPAGWRQASPHWDKRRERFIAERLAFALSPEFANPDEPDPQEWFRAQWLNQWPRRNATGRTRGEPLVAADVWESCRGVVVDDPDRIVAAVADYAGLGVAIAAVVVQPDGRLGVDGWTVAGWADALADLRRLQAGHESFRVFADPMLKDRMPPGLRASTAPATLTRSGLSLLRELAAAGGVVSDSVDLADQLGSVRVADSVGGLTIVPGARADLVRAAAWAVAAVHRPRRTPSVH